MTETQAEKIAQGIAYKDEGNEHFKNGEWKQAIASYHHAGLYLAGIVSENSTLFGLMGNGAAPTEQITDSRKQLSIVRNNMAACFLKLENYPRAIQCADQCLAIDPSNMKASYRKLQALRFSKDLNYKTYLNELLEKHPREEMLIKELEEFKIEEKKKIAEADKKMSGFLNRKKPAAAGASASGSSSTAVSGSGTASSSTTRPAAGTASGSGQRPIGGAPTLGRGPPGTRH